MFGTVQTAPDIPVKLLMRDETVPQNVKISRYPSEYLDHVQRLPQQCLAAALFLPGRFGFTGRR